MKILFQRFMSNQSGTTSIEYALIGAGIGLVIITAATNIGTEVAGIFSEVDQGFKSR